MFKIVLKFVFAIGIIFWLLKSGKLDFTLVSKSITSGYNWLICLSILAIQDIVSSIRWRLILKAKSDKPLPIIDMVRVTWIGLFFNSFLPGAVTGDFIKLVYARDLDKDVSKTFLVTSVLMDRIFGLIGLLCILGISSLIYYNEIVSISPEMKKLVHFNFLLFLGAIGFIISLFIHKSVQEFLLRTVLRIPVLGKRIAKTLTQAWAIGENKKIVISCIFMSIFLQFINFMAFYIVSSPFYGKEIPVPYILTFIPLGFMAVAIPISPAGLGVGHVIFDKLFSFSGVAGGASFFNLYFLCLVFVNLFGFFPYILSGKRHKLAETHQFDDVEA